MKPWLLWIVVFSSVVAGVLTATWIWRYAQEDFVPTPTIFDKPPPDERTLPPKVGDSLWNPSNREKK